ncbi:hypothetical protein [Nostoc sp. DSM 114161]
MSVFKSLDAWGNRKASTASIAAKSFPYDRLSSRALFTKDRKTL